MFKFIGEESVNIIASYPPKSVLVFKFKVGLKLLS